MSVGPSGAVRSTGQKSTRARGSAPYSATWICRERSQPTSVQSPSSGGPASRNSPSSPEQRHGYMSGPLPSERRSIASKSSATGGRSSS